MKKQIDALDIEILKYLEDDARKSLKKLADDLNKKTSTIYHRLQRLKSNEIILGYSIIFNPKFLNIKKISFEKVVVKPLNFSSLDDMFIKSFANFLDKEFPQVLFIALSEDTKVIYLISIHRKEEDHDKFIEKLKNNPYIESIESEFFSQIIKGQKIFNFDEQWITKKAKHGKDELNLEEDLDEDEKARSMEVIIDDDYDIKF
ncbi:MAG: Lrp/AsnC family transcriptional regulator [Promethearchaeota archaeon]